MDTQVYSVQTLNGEIKIEPEQLAGETEHFIIHPEVRTILKDSKPDCIDFSMMYYAVSHKTTGLKVGCKFYNSDLAMSAAQALENAPVEWDHQDLDYFRSRLPLAKVRHVIQDRGGTFETQKQMNDRIKAMGVVLTPEMAALCSP